MTLGTTSGSDTSMNACGIPFGHAYSLLSAFTLLDKTLATTDAAYNQSMIMFRNPWGLDNTYNQTWKASSSKWTADNIAQVPLGVNPTLSQLPDGVVVLPVSLIPTCFGNYYIGHLRDGQGFTRSWFDQEAATASATTFTWTPNTINDTVYISVENYPLNLVPSACLTGGSAAALVNLEITHNSKYYQMSWYDQFPYWIAIPASVQSATSPFSITITYTWNGSPSNEYTVSVYSATPNIPVLNSTNKNNSYFMDGRSPSGFTNSKYCGINCIPTTPVTPTPTPTPTVVNPQTVVVKSLFDVFAKATDIGTFFAIIWYNPWVLFAWFSFW